MATCSPDMHCCITDKRHTEHYFRLKSSQLCKSQLVHFQVPSVSRLPTYNTFQASMYRLKSPLAVPSCCCSGPCSLLRLCCNAEAGASDERAAAGHPDGAEGRHCRQMKEQQQGAILDNCMDPLLDLLIEQLPPATPGKKGQPGPYQQEQQRQEHQGALAGAAAGRSGTAAAASDPPGSCSLSEPLQLLRQALQRHELSEVDLGLLDVLLQPDEQQPQQQLASGEDLGGLDQQVELAKLQLLYLLRQRQYLQQQQQRRLQEQHKVEQQGR